MSKYWPATDLTGGGFGALDNIDGDLLVDGDAAIVVVPSGAVYFYSLDASSGAAESPPNIIAPDVNPGTKRWLIRELNLGLLNHIGFNTAPTGVPTQEGTLSHDPDTHMLSYRSDIDGVKHGMLLSDLARIRNATGTKMLRGSPVMNVGAYDDFTFNMQLSSAVIGMRLTGAVTNDIEPGEFGWVSTRGIFDNYDTRVLGASKLLYVSTTPGEYTTTPPTPPDYAVPIGFTMDAEEFGHISIYASSPTPIIAATDAAVASGDPTGFHDNENILVEYDQIARTITLTGNLKYSWRGQVKELESPWTSDAHDATLDEAYYLASTDGINFIWATDVWEFSDVWIAFVHFGTNDKYAIREVHGLMNWQSHEEFHQTVGTYRISGGTLSNYTTASITPDDRRPDVSTTNIKDEDISTINDALTTGLYTTAFLTGSGILEFTVGESDIVPLSGSTPFWNEFVSPNWQQSPMTNGNYMSVWLVAVPAADGDSQNYRFLWVQGQSLTSLPEQEVLAPSSVTLGNLTDLFTEFIFITKTILHYTGNNWQIHSVENLTGTRANFIGAPSGNYLSVVEHNSTLTGDGTTGDPLSVSSEIARSGANTDIASLGVCSSVTGGNNTTLTLQGSNFSITPPPRNAIDMFTGTVTGSSGHFVGVNIAPTIVQTTSAGYTVLRIDVTEGNTGSGVKLLQEWQVDGATKVCIDNTGLLRVEGHTAPLPASLIPGSTNLLLSNQGSSVSLNCTSVSSGTSGNRGTITFGRARGTYDTPLVPVDGDNAGGIISGPWVGESWYNTASIEFAIDGDVVNEDPGPKAAPQRILFRSRINGLGAWVEHLVIKSTGIINLATTATPVYADNTAAKSGGLTDGDFYRTSTGVMMIVYT